MEVRNRLKRLDLIDRVPDELWTEVHDIVQETGISDQCKEIEENNRMGKTRDLFKKIRATKGIFHAKMGSIKDRNGIDLILSKDGLNKGQKWYRLNRSRRY